MSEKHKHESRLTTLKYLLLLSPVLFVWVEIVLPIMVAPLFGKNDSRAFIYSFIGYGIYLIYTYLLMLFSLSAIKDAHAPLPKKLLYVTYIILGIVILAGLHAGTMIFLGLSTQGAN